MKLGHKLTVVSVWFNRTIELNASINSVLAQTYQDFDLLIVNDGSTDPGFIHAANQIDDPRISVRTADNVGFTKALNAALNSVTTDFVAIHGAGDIAFPQKLEKQMAHLENNPGTSAVGCGHELVSAATGGRIKSVVPATRSTLADLVRSVPFTHGTVVYRTADLRMAGGYDEAFVFSQDWELYSRLVRIGELQCLPLVLYQKKMFPDGATYSPEKKLIQLAFAKEASRRACGLKPQSPESITSLGQQLRIGFSMVAGLLWTRDFHLAFRWMKWIADLLLNRRQS